MEYPAEYLRHRERIRAWMLGRGFYRAVEALEYAAKYHDGYRKDGFTPEFHHQVSIAHYLRTLPGIRNLEDVLTAAFLHDTIEDKDITAEEIADRFGLEVARAVSLLTKKSRGMVKDKEDYFKRMSDNPIASIVKGGDRIHNYQTMAKVFTCTKQLKYIREGENYILPMLKEARNNFPDQELAYENIKYTLKGQMELLRLSIEARNKVFELKEVIKNGENKATEGSKDVLRERKPSEEVGSLTK
jgi:(p)ppGpp synthase/HD superfamily hydrolase